MSYDLCKRVSNQVESEMPYSLRQRKPNQLQGAMTEIDEDRTLLMEAPRNPHNGDLLASSAKRARTKRFCIGTKYANSQRSTLETQCNNSPSSSEEIVHKHPGLSKLKPPSRSNGFSTKESSLLIQKWTSLNLISYFKYAKNADVMIEVSSASFIALDALRVDYTAVYQAVYSVISHQYDKEALANQKPHADYEIKAAHDQMASEFSKEEERYTVYNQVLKEAQDDIDGLTARINRLYGKLKKAEEKKANAEAKAAAARADKVSCGEAYDKAKQKLEEIAPKMGEAQKAIDEFETRWKETANGLKLAMDELSCLRV